MTINGPVLNNARIREDGRVVRDYYLFRVKSPEESKAPWDDYKLEQTVPGEQLVRPLSESECPLVRKTWSFDNRSVHQAPACLPR